MTEPGSASEPQKCPMCNHDERPATIAVCPTCQLHQSEQRTLAPTPPARSEVEGPSVLEVEVRTRRNFFVKQEAENAAAGKDRTYFAGQADAYSWVASEMERARAALRSLSVQPEVESAAMEALLGVVKDRHKKCSKFHVGSGASRDIRECFALSALVESQKGRP